MQDYFNHNQYVDNVVSNCKLSRNEVDKILCAHKNHYPQGCVYAIPICINITPQPYKPIRINPITKNIYVPGKEKLVNSIRNSIISEIGIAWFENGFFPLYSEIALYIELYYPTPKSFSRENKYLAEIKMLRKINFPDNDNTEKIIFDSVKSFLIYDDAQIVTNITEKYYSIKPRIQIVIYYNTAEAFYLHKKVIQHRKDMWTRNENFDKLLYKVVKK